jgi:hydrogenase large subunit
MTMTEPRKTSTQDTDVVEMSWDPVTRIVGSLGIYASIDFKQKEVRECHSTSSIFRGYSLFMQGKDPRDAHFITSRICGICGDNHATCSVYNQNMAYGIAPPHLGEWIINLGEAAEYMFDHNIFQENLVGVDYCERMVKETNPGVLERADTTEAPHADIHGYRTIGDIMRALNPLEGEFYREALHVSRYTREMFCLMEGRHVHPSTLYPGGVGTTATIQLFTDYLTRLMRYVEFMKKVVPLHDDLFDFFYEALPGYEHVGERRILLGCWGSLNDPAYCDFRYATMSDWGKKMFVTPGVVVDGKLVTNDLVDINLGIRILLGSSYYEDWVASGRETFVTRDPLGNPVDARHPWNQHTIPKPAKRDFDNQYSWTMSPRWFDGKDHLALDTGGGPIARLWSTALSGLVDCGYVRATGSSVVINLPRTALKPEVTFEWKVPRWSNAIERNRARTYFQAYAAALALHFTEMALAEVRAGRTDTWTSFEVPDTAVSVGFTEAVRGVLSHHMVIRDGKIANYHPYPPTPWNGSVRDNFGTPGPYEDAVQNTPIFEENPPDTFKGIDIMRAVRSFDPCLPCGVHMYTGGGKVVEQLHTPSMPVKPY